MRRQCKVPTSTARTRAKISLGIQKIGSFTFTGIELTQQADSSIILSQSKYVRKISAIAIDVNQKTQPELSVTETERDLLRGLAGSLQYAAVSTRPDVSSRLSLLQSAINTAKVETLQEANKLLHEANKHHDVGITIKPIAYRDFRCMAFSDASFSSAKKPDAHASFWGHTKISHTVPFGSIILGVKENSKGSHQYLSCRICFIGISS